MSLFLTALICNGNFSSGSSAKKFILSRILGRVELKLAGENRLIFFSFLEIKRLNLKQITSLLQGNVTIIIRENCIKSSSSSL